MSLLKKIKARIKGKVAPEERAECQNGHNCEALDRLDNTQISIDKRIEQILKSDSFSKLMKRDTERV